MKQIEKLLLEASAYSSFIIFTFLLFTMPDNVKMGGLTLGTFVLIFFFGIIISLTGLIFNAKTLKVYWKVIIHYTVLFLAFLIIFMISGNLFTESSGSIFSAIVIFTFLYAAVFGATVLAKKLVRAADVRIEKANEEKAKKNTEDKKRNEYKPLYK